MPGQADSAPDFDDIAALIYDNPDELGPLDAGDNAEIGKPAAETPKVDPADPDGEPEPDESDPADDEPNDDEPEGDGDEGKPARQDDELVEVTLKADDGTETKEKVPLSELKNGYLRHSDYTRKTQELSTQRNEAMQIVERKITESRDHYMTEAAIAHQAIVRLAALKTPQEMAELAARDPQEATREEMRQRAVLAVLDEIRGGVVGEKQTMSQQQQEREQAEAAKAREALVTSGFKLDKVPELFEGIHKTYGVPRERLSKVLDPALVRIFDDAMNWKRAQANAAARPKPGTVATNGKPASRVPVTPPAPRQSAPREAKADKALNARFQSGRARTSDLASWIMKNG